MSVLFLLVLIASFLGVDLGIDEPLLDGSPCAAGDRGSSEDVSASTDWASDWYAWESCLLGEPWPDIELTASEAEALIYVIWQGYTPWTERTLEWTYREVAPNVSARDRLVPPT